MTKTMSLPLTVDVSRVRRLLDEGADIRVLDVRTPAEFEAVHIRGAYNVPLDTLGEHREELRRHVSEPVVLVCRSGSRARKAEQALREAGMENLHVMEGGMVAWEAAGHPVRRGRQKWSLERQVRLVAGTLALAGSLGGLFLATPLAWLSAFVGAGLAFSAVTDTCGMAMLLAKLPYNRGAVCDVRDVVKSLRNGAPSANTNTGAGIGQAAAASPACS